MRKLLMIATISAASLAVTGCVTPSEPEPRPAPAAPVPIPAPAPAPAPAPLGADWRDWPLTPGTWTYRQDGRGSIALFGVAGQDAVFTLRCDRDRARLYLSRRAGSATTPATAVLRTSTLLRTLSMAPTGGTPHYLAAELGVRDALPDAMGYSRGRFVMESAGLPTLVIPAWAEILRVAEDCR
ncbi:hypothetical protein [Sphingomonas sp. M1-B02]|uniref:hypothetical protein n=1 Tax=Sphingomonas sp. M1-B02 TaxID=3114300 RepID=UPI0022407E52|nr:hypothetical protein [Sphingomonas sp. S6-11]UZK65815.1 hypothetical protein OKW87_15080 [Sphingomonas sp. S6-11]